MLRRIIADPKLPVILSRIDSELAQKTRTSGCPFCKAPLHSARYPRKPRCEKPLAPDWGWRLSFCCAASGCRRRTTPPSVRFFGRRFYPGAVVVLLSALAEGPTPRRLKVLRAALGVDRRTLARWRAWWRETFSQTRFFKEIRAQFLPPLESDSLPLSLLKHFGKFTQQAVIDLLRFLTPFSPSAPADHDPGKGP